MARAILLLLRRASITASTCTGELQSIGALVLARIEGLRTSSRDSTLAVWPTKT